MTTDTNRIKLPYILQSQKEVTHNDALNRLDAFVTPVVADSPQSSVSVRVYQISAVVGRGYAAEAVV